MTTKQTRGKFLLKAAADAFEQGRDPFSPAWLSEHEVTAQECFDLGQALSVVIKAYLATSPEKRAELLLVSVCGEGEEAERVREFLHARHARKRMVWESGKTRKLADGTDNT